MHRLAPMHPSFGLAWPDFGFELGDALKCGVGDSFFTVCLQRYFANGFEFWYGCIDCVR